MAKSDFEVLQEMSKNELDIFTSPHVLNVRQVGKVKKGEKHTKNGKIEFLIDGETAQKYMKGLVGHDRPYRAICYIIDEDWFNVLKNKD